MPKVSVIIPAYNSSAHIKGAIESVLEQSYPDKELIVIDDGSTDDLKKTLESYLGDKKILYYRIEHKGVSRAINFGLGCASGDYISFLHADDLFRTKKIEKQATLMQRNPAYVISYTSENYFLEGKKYSIRSTYFHFSGDIFYFLKRNNFIHMSTVMIRKDIKDKMLLDESLASHEEWDAFLKISKMGFRFLYIDEALSDICVHPLSLSSNKKIMDDTRSIVGKRARILWRDFRETINIYSIKGILNLSRYLKFKIYAFLINFPKENKFNLKVPQDLLKNA